MTEKTPEGRFPFVPEAKQGNLVLALVISVAALAALALTLVWLNIERTKLAYRIRTLQHEAAQISDLNAKLGIERELLLSPRELGKKAERAGLGPAKPGQIRRMQDTDADAEPSSTKTDPREQRQTEKEAGK